MKKLSTNLITSHDLLHRLVHLKERPKEEWIRFKDDILDWPTQDMLTLICESDNKFLIGKFRADYDYCPEDWDFLTKHTKRNELPYKKLSEIIPENYGIRFVRHIRAYHDFSWLDIDMKLWWHFIPFHILVEEGQPIIPKNSKYSEFRWVNRNEISKFDRQGYLENIAKNTLDVSHLYIQDFTTIFDRMRNYYSFSPHEI